MDAGSIQLSLILGIAILIVFPLIILLVARVLRGDFWPSRLASYVRDGVK